MARRCSWRPVKSIRQASARDWRTKGGYTKAYIKAKIDRRVYALLKQRRAYLRKVR